MKIIIHLITLAIAYKSYALEKGSSVGCFKKTHHDNRGSLRYIRNCFDHCSNQFYR